MKNKTKEEIREQRRKYYIANKERARETSRKYHIANREKIKEKDRKYRIANREKILERERKYRIAHPEIARKYRLVNREKILERKRKYYLANPEIAKAWRIANKEKMRELQRQGNQRIKKEVLKHYSNNSFQCSNCGYDIFNGLVIDHAYGGGARHRKEIGIRGGSGFYHWLINNKFPQGFQVLCHDCNFLKSSYPEDYIKIGEKYRELKS